jgi:hypothetical protein
MYQKYQCLYISASQTPGLIPVAAISNPWNKEVSNNSDVKNPNASNPSGSTCVISNDGPRLEVSMLSDCARETIDDGSEEIWLEVVVALFSLSKLLGANG